MKLAFVVTSCVLLLAGCSGDRRIDGIPVGPEGRGGDGHSLNQDFAMAMLDQQWPGHAPMEGYGWFQPRYRDVDRDANFVRTRPGYVDQVIVIKLTDGTVHALYIGCRENPDLDSTNADCFLGPPDELKGR